MPARSELVAHGLNTEEVAAVIGADLVIYQTLPDMISSVRQFNPSITDFDCSVFTGQYITGGVDEGYLQYLEQMRADNVKSKIMPENFRTPNVNGISVALGSAGKEIGFGCSVPLNGANDTVGLYNSWRVSQSLPTSLHRLIDVCSQQEKPGKESTTVS